MDHHYLMMCVTASHKRFDKCIRLSMTASNDVVSYGVKGIRVASYDVLKVREEGSSCNHSIGTSDSDQSMDHHCVVQIQEKCQFLVC